MAPMGHVTVERDEVPLRVEREDGVKEVEVVPLTTS